MTRLRRIIAEAASMVITESDIEAAFESALEEFDFSDLLKDYAERKLESLGYLDEVVKDVAESMIDE